MMSNNSSNGDDIGHGDIEQPDQQQRRDTTEHPPPQRIIPEAVAVLIDNNTSSDSIHSAIAAATDVEPGVIQSHHQPQTSTIPPSPAPAPAPTSSPTTTTTTTTTNNNWYDTTLMRISSIATIFMLGLVLGWKLTPLFGIIILIAAIGLAIYFMYESLMKSYFSSRMNNNINGNNNELDTYQHGIATTAAAVAPTSSSRSQEEPK